MRRCGEDTPSGRLFIAAVAHDDFGDAGAMVDQIAAAHVGALLVPQKGRTMLHLDDAPKRPQNDASRMILQHLFAGQELNKRLDESILVDLDIFGLKWLVGVLDDCDCVVGSAREFSIAIFAECVTEHEVDLAIELEASTNIARNENAAVFLHVA